jgi:hypothetical protein
MDQDTEKLLKENGWVVECFSPLEISHEDGSFASGSAAKILISQLQEEVQVSELQDNAKNVAALLRTHKLGVSKAEETIQALLPNIEPLLTHLGVDL